MKGTRNCAKRRKRRISSTFKPVVQEHEKKSTSVIRKRLRKNGKTFSKSSVTEDKHEQSVNGAGIPTVTASNSLGYRYDARRKNIESFAKFSLDILFGAWHRNVLPTLPSLARNPHTGNRYIELPNQFYVLSCDTCKVNNTVLVENHFEKHLKWRKTDEKRQDFKFKWTQCVDQIDYNQFRDYEQVVNHISNISCLTSKIGLVESLRAYEQTMQQKALQSPNSSKNNELKLADFFNETFILNNKTENAAFRKAYKAGETWICKPSGLNQGIGIFLVRSLDDLDAKLKDCSSKKSPPKRETSNKYERIIQRYIEHPLLLDNKKIDIRAYMLIASTAPFVVFYHPGYLRTCIDDYKLDDNSLIGHLNNQYIQKSHPSYEKKKNDTIWSYERANAYLNQYFIETKGIEEDWWYRVFEKQAKRIMLHCFNAVKSTLKTRIGTFDLLGFDFMIDEKMKVYLIEINVQPSLTTNCQVLHQAIPQMVYESIDVVMEIWEKTRRGVPINPIQSRRNMEVLYNETTQSKVWTRRQQSTNNATNFTNGST